MKRQYSSLKSKQQGAALVVGLIVLLIMTIIGISSIGTTTNQLRIAANTQSYQGAYQAAVAAINEIKSQNPNVSPVPQWDSGVEQDLSGGFVPIAGADGISTYQVPDIKINYVGCELVPTGYSLTQDVTMKGVIQHVRATGELSVGGNVISTSVVNNGVKTIFPGCPANNPVAM